MTELSAEHILLFVILAFLLYYLIGNCGCRNGFRVGKQRFSECYLDEQCSDGLRCSVVTGKGTFCVYPEEYNCLNGNHDLIRQRGYSYNSENCLQTTRKEERYICGKDPFYPDSIQCDVSMADRPGPTGVHHGH